MNMTAIPVADTAYFINVNSCNPDIQVNLAYATKNNFLGFNLYNSDPTTCFLPRETADMLCKAQDELKKNSPYYNLIVYDGCRPLHIQQLMWDSLKLPLEKKVKYLAYPGSISLHNYGAAVDVSLIGSDKKIIDMGTTFDYFGPEAHINREDSLLKAGKLTREQLWHRLLLRKAMVKAGFKTMSTEWWHFNVCTKEEAAARFRLIR